MKRPKPLHAPGDLAFHRGRRVTILDVVPGHPRWRYIRPDGVNAPPEVAHRSELAVA